MRSTVDTLRGLSRLIVTATTGVVDVVEAMQRAIGGGPEVLGRPLLAPTRIFSAPVYAGIRGVTRAIGGNRRHARSRRAVAARCGSGNRR